MTTCKITPTAAITAKATPKATVTGFDEKAPAFRPASADFCAILMPNFLASFSIAFAAAAPAFCRASFPSFARFFSFLASFPGLIDFGFVLLVIVFMNLSKSFCAFSSLRSSNPSFIAELRTVSISFGSGVRLISETPISAPLSPTLIASGFPS